MNEALSGNNCHMTTLTRKRYFRETFIDQISVIGGHDILHKN